MKTAPRMNIVSAEFKANPFSLLATSRATHPVHCTTEIATYCMRDVELVRQIYRRMNFEPESWRVLLRARGHGSPFIEVSVPRVIYAGLTALSGLCYKPMRQVLPMRVASIINPVRKRHTRLARVLALFFLIFTGADISMPQYFCGGEEVGNLPTQSRSAKTTVPTTDESRTIAIYSSQESQPGGSPEQAPHEEDCFCCCAHVLPGLTFKNADYSEIKSPRAPAEMNRLLSPPLQSTYHPPRFA